MIKIKGKQYSRPAIILGNGINRQDKSVDSWNTLLNKLAHKYKININLDDKDKSVSSPEIFEQIMIQIFKKSKDEKSAQKIYVELKKEFCKLIKDPSFFTTKPIIEKASNIEYPFPILTTNYDFNLLDENIFYKNSSVKKEKKPACVPGKKNFPRVYNFFNFYAHNDYQINSYDCKRNFGIWHLHGIKCYSESLKISSSDYMSLISYIKKNFLKGNRKLWNPNNPDYDKWEGRNSWLDIFLNNDLIIIGLALDVQELDLRWLLIERAKHLKARNLKHKTVYYYTEYDLEYLFIESDKSKPNGKYLFFESLGIELIEAKSDDLYKSF